MLMGEKDSHITLDNVEEVNNKVINAFPGTNVNTNNMGERIRKAYGINGSTFYIYYRNKNAKILIPKKYNTLIKNKLESTGLKCQ